jgi:prepilin-type N-terminal cleavage/methylation domain-containing protein
LVRLGGGFRTNWFERAFIGALVKPIQIEVARIRPFQIVKTGRARCLRIRFYSHFQKFRIEIASICFSFGVSALGLLYLGWLLPPKEETSMKNTVPVKQITSRTRSRAFTLIELLIVVAIIAILAAIAVPNFLEAQVRAKVSRAQADMRSLATALESYVVDHNKYPRARTKITPVDDGSVNWNLIPLAARMYGLTTPIAYITQLPPEVFPPTAGWNGVGSADTHSLKFEHFDTYDYFDSQSDWDEDMRNPATGVDSTRGYSWRLASIGPDRWGSFGIVWRNVDQNNRQGVDYDATNGTASNGDIIRVGGTRFRDWSYDRSTSTNP